MSRWMGGADPAASGAATHNEDQARRVLAAFLESSANALLGTFRLYVVRAGLATGPEATAAALDVLQETAAEALAHAARFDPSRPPGAWLLGIAVNVIKRRVAEEANRRRRELHVLGESDAGVNADDAALEATLATPDCAPGDALTDAESAASLLALVADDDAEVLRLALIEECDATALAARLSTTPGAARMRLHRALRRLRAAWLSQAAGDAGAADEHPPEEGGRR